MKEKNAYNLNDHADAFEIDWQNQMQKARDSNFCIHDHHGICSQCWKGD